MSDVIFHKETIDWIMPNIQLFGVWNNDGGPNSAPYYNTYRKLAKFLVDRYGNNILYDLYHETAIGKQALENVLGKRGISFSSVETDFEDYCVNFGYPKDNEARIVVIENVTSTGEIGVWLTANLPLGNALPVNIAIQYGTISKSTIGVSLVVPNDNTWNGGSTWIGNGNYFVYLVPVSNQTAHWDNALVYTGEGTMPVKVTFNKAITKLSYNAFRVK
jgi:hypothetical protein